MEVNNKSHTQNIEPFERKIHKKSRLNLTNDIASIVHDEGCIKEGIESSLIL